MFEVTDQYLSLFELFRQVFFGLVGAVQLHVEVVHCPLRLFTLQLYPLSQLDLLLQCPLLINQLTRHLQRKEKRKTHRS